MRKILVLALVIAAAEALAVEVAGARPSPERISTALCSGSGSATIRCPAA
jgi:hypothetical protein